MVAEVSESDFKSVVRKAQVILSLGLKVCVVNEVFDSEVFVYPNREESLFVQLLGSLCRSSAYVDYDVDEDKESRLWHLIYDMLVVRTSRRLLTDDAPVCL